MTKIERLQAELKSVQALQYREDNTEGYTAEQLARLNRQWAEQGGDALEDPEERAWLNEQILERFDSAAALDAEDAARPAPEVR